jgi:hypothetical protein
MQSAHTVSRAAVRRWPVGQGVRVFGNVHRLGKCLVTKTGVTKSLHRELFGHPATSSEFVFCRQLKAASAASSFDQELEAAKAQKKVRAH